MSIYPNVTEEGMNKLVILSLKQKSQRTKKIKNRLLKQTPFQEIAETFKAINKRKQVKKSA